MERGGQYCVPALLLFGLIGACAACPLPARAADLPPSPVLAEVDGRAITAADLDAELGRPGSPAPGAMPSAEELRRQLESLVRLRALAAAARAAGFERRPEVQSAITQLLAARYREEQLEPQLAAVRVTDEELERFYREHPEEFVVPRRIRGAVVRVGVSAKAPEAKRQAARAKAETALVEARNLPPGTPAFGAVAVKHSDDQSTRYRGGETGWLSEGQEEPRWPAPVVSALFAVQPAGALGPVVEAPDGYYLVKVIEEKPAAPRPLPEVREALLRKLLLQKREGLARDFYEKVERDARVVVHEDALGRLLAGAAGTGPGKSGPPELPGR